MIALIDGSALFFAGTKIGKKINYKNLKTELNITTGHFFSAIDEENSKQQDFLRMISSAGFKDYHTSPYHARLCSHLWEVSCDVIRFSTWISFALGRIKDRSEKIVVISDCFDLHAPIIESCRDGFTVELAFIKSALDPRWHKLIMANEVKFIDLTNRKIFLTSGGNFQETPHIYSGNNQEGV